MSVYDDVLTSVISLAEQADLYSHIVIGPMPPKNGISIAWATGNLNTFLNKKAAVVMSAVFKLQKFRSGNRVGYFGENSHVFKYAKNYPESDNFQITNIKTTSAPSYLGREENDQWLYGSSLEVKFFLKGD